MKRFGVPKTIVTDRLRSCVAVMKDIGNANSQEVGLHLDDTVWSYGWTFRITPLAFCLGLAQRELPQVVTVA